MRSTHTRVIFASILGMAASVRPSVSHSNLTVEHSTMRMPRCVLKRALAVCSGSRQLMIVEYGVRAGLRSDEGPVAPRSGENNIQLSRICKAMGLGYWQLRSRLAVFCHEQSGGSGAGQPVRF